VRGRLAAYRSAPAGGALLFVFAAALAVLVLGPHRDEGAALIVLVVVLGLFATGAGARGGSGERPDSGAEDRRP
jgi:UDP-N-acetylmuramyl pentapeptide phosphotransferase/UDP-N-acetylglucosamine-1-phosphate transferase